MKKILPLIFILYFIATNNSESSTIIKINYNTNIHFTKKIESNKSYDDVLKETLTIEKIKNPFIIKHLFKNSYTQIMEQISSMIIMHEQGKNIIPQIDSIEKIIKHPKFLAEIIQADLLQIELNKLEKIYNSLSDSEKVELINPAIINPYNSNYNDIKDDIMVYSHSNKSKIKK